MFKVLCFPISFVLVCALTGSISQAQENQFYNSEFDDGLNAWGSYGSAGFTREVVQSGALSGKNAVLLDITDASAAASIGIFQGIPRLVQDQTYPLGFIAKSDQEREMVVLIQLYKPEVPSWTDIFLATVQLTPDPQKYSLEYTHEDESTAEHPGWSVNMYLMLKAQWWGMTGSDLNTKVWIDWVYFGAEPEFQDRSRALDPTPADGGAHADTWVNLHWMPGEFALSHDVYLGERFDDVNDGAEGTFIGNQSSTSLIVGFPGFPYPDGLVLGTTYYWRIDEVNDADPNSPWKGPVWSFTVPSKIAYDPSPPDGAKFVDPNVVFTWGTGFGSKLHTIYFGDNFDDVNNAVAGMPQAETTYTPGTLELEKTYYWRVDEFGGTATEKGDVWSFTVTKPGGGLKAEYFNNRDLSGEPVLTRIDPEIDFSWGFGNVPGENSPDPSINADNFSARWSGELEVDITDTYTFHITANNGFRLWLDGELIIDFWDSPTTYSRESEPIELVGGDIHSIQMEYFEGLETAVAQLFWESSKRQQQIIPSAALQPPLKASSPNPSSHAVDVKLTQIMSWSAVEDATSHQLYFGTDGEALKNADTSSPEYKGNRNPGSESYDPGPLQWNTTYYWRVDEVKADGTVQVGNVWSFTTVNFILVDDFESYNDIDPPDPASNRIFDKWIDGFGTLTNGALVGNDVPPYAEQTIVHGGAQAMIYRYENNLKTSEATLTLVSPRDWTEEGIGELSLWFQGDSANTAERLYVAIANATGGYAVVYHEDPDAATADSWTQWVIPLQAFADQGINLANVDKIAVGTGTRGDAATPGGSGTMYFDDIRLYRSGEAAGQ